MRNLPIELRLAYYLKKHAYKRVGILATNTPAFLESIFAIAAAGAVNVGMYVRHRQRAEIMSNKRTAINYRLKEDDIRYIFEHSEVDLIIVDYEYIPMLGAFRIAHPAIPILVDVDSNDVDGPFDKAVIEGLEFDAQTGQKQWAGLLSQASDENEMLAIAYTSGTTSRPKGVIYSHRGCYMAAVSNIIESGLNRQTDRCKYLWVLPMFHAMGS